MGIIRKFRGDVWVGVVRNAGREGQQVEVRRVSELDDVDMNTILIVGNSETRVVDGKMFTPRGYSNKYQIAESRKSEKMGASTRAGLEVARRSEEILRSFTRKRAEGRHNKEMRCNNGRCIHKRRDQVFRGA